jgi:hypothetical protein
MGKNMKIVLEKPDGSPYLTLRKDTRLAYIQIHDYDFMGDPVEFNFDVRALPMLIAGLTKLNEQDKVSL